MDYKNLPTPPNAVADFCLIPVSRALVPRTRVLPHPSQNPLLLFSFEPAPNANLEHVHLSSYADNRVSRLEPQLLQSPMKSLQSNV
jgi:hypothetical protein